MTKKEEVIDKILNYSKSHFPDSEVILYGSQARGDSNPNSDWDILLLLSRQNISFDLETKIMDDFYEIELETGQVISPLIYSKYDWQSNHTVTPLYKNIQKEGVKLK
jgi:predicted nucleotidyltransferase